MTGQSFEHHLRESVFAPLGMHSAGFARDERSPGAYFRGADGAIVRGEDFPPNELPAGGVILSGADMAAFLARLVDPDRAASFLNEPMRRALFTRGPYRPLSGVRQQPGIPAAGFFIDDRNGRTLAYHTGSKPGHLAYCHVSPADRKACFTFLTGPMTDVATIWRLYLADVDELLGTSPTEAVAAAAPAADAYCSDSCVDALPVHRPSDLELEACVGRYGVVGFYEIEFVAEGGTLRTDYGKMEPLRPVAPFEFVASRFLPGERIRFVREPGEREATAVYVSLTRHTRFRDEATRDRHRALIRARFGNPARNG